MQVPTPQADARELRSICGVRAAHSARDGARPQPLTLALWSLPVPLRLTLRPAHVGMELGSRGDCQMDRGTGMELERTNWVYSGARGGFYETLTSLLATPDYLRPSLWYAASAMRSGESPAARITHALLPSAQPLSPSQLLWRREQYYFSILSVYTSLRASTQPLSSARRHVRTRLCCAFEPCCAFNR